MVKAARLPIWLFLTYNFLQRSHWSQFPVRCPLIYIPIDFLSLPLKSQLPETMDFYYSYSLLSPYCWEHLAHCVCLVSIFSLAIPDVLALTRAADTFIPGIDTEIHCSYILGENSVCWTTPTEQCPWYSVAFYRIHYILGDIDCQKPLPISRDQFQTTW